VTATSPGSNPGGALGTTAVSGPNSFYGANYALPPTGGSAVVLPGAGGTNLGYTTSGTAYYSGNVPGISGNSPVRPMNPSDYGANFGGRSVFTPGSPWATNPTNPSGPSSYGANYGGTVNFNPGPAAGAYPSNPSGTSFYGADYSGTAVFTPGSVGPSP